MMERSETAALQLKAIELRRSVIDMIADSCIPSGHFGGSLSPAEIVAVLYFHQMRVDPSRPRWPDRDRLVLSKGHAVSLIYAALADRGYFPPSTLRTYREEGSILQGHPDCLKTPGLDASGGSLGQGLSIGLGMALAAGRKKTYHVYVLLSDGEMQEGMVWEAAMAAAHYGTGNLTALVDCNNLQVGGRIGDVMNIEPLADKWKAFGWDVFSVNGHSVEELLLAFEARARSALPAVILCTTTKGKGVSFMENDIEWHCSAITPELRDRALRELEEAGKTYLTGAPV